MTWEDSALHSALMDYRGGYRGYVRAYMNSRLETHYVAKFRHPIDGWMDEDLGEFPTREEAKSALVARVAQYILSH